MEKKNDIICQSNALTNARYDFSPIEKNVLYFVIQKVRESYVDGTIPYQQNLFNDNMTIYLKSSALSEIADENHTKRARMALRDLRHRDFPIQNEKGKWVEVGFINYAEYDPSRNCYEIEVSKKILPHLVELAKKFTSYSLTVAISLKSKYSKRFYELGCQYRSNVPKRFWIDIDELRKMFCLGDGYKLKSDIKKRIIDVAMAEIKKAYEEGVCDLWIEPWEVGKGEKTRFYFNVHTRLDADNKKDSNVLKEQLTAIHNILVSTFKKDRKFPKYVVDYLSHNTSMITPVYEKLIHKLNEEVKKGEEPGALFRFILKHDFGIEKP